MKQHLKFLYGYSDTEDFTQKKALLSISLAQYSMPQLEKAIQKILRRFGKMDVILFDSVQRYNFIWQENLSEEEAHKKAIAWGDNWLAEYSSIICNNDKITVLRWDAWLQASQFKAHKKSIESIYTDFPGFKSAIIETTLAYLRRYASRNQSFNLEKAKQLSIELIKEEAAVLLLAAERGYDFDISFEKTKSLKYLYEYIVRPKSLTLLQPIIIKTYVKSHYEV